MAGGADLGLVRLDDSELLLAEPAEDLRGLTVVDPHQHRVGEVRGLFIDEDERRTRLLVVTSGGLMGLSVTERLIPIDAVSRVDDKVHLATPHQQVHHARTDPALGPTPAYEEMCTRYGYSPFWTPGYVHPSFSGALGAPDGPADVPPVSSGSSGGAPEDTARRRRSA